MKLIHHTLIAVALLSLSSCGKELSLEMGDINAIKEKQFENLLVARKFQLKGFYSDIPIDYVQTDDTVKQETNLWPYVSNYLKDDLNSFAANGTDVAVEQSAIKLPGNDDPVLHRKYSVTKDDKGVHVDFLDYQYNALKYDLYKVGPDYFIFSIKWKNGATLYSRFEIVP